MPASGEIMMPAVSVCHQVSTIGHSPFPICSLNQCQASSLIGSPTLPSLVREERSLSSTNFIPDCINERIAVGRSEARRVGKECGSTCRSRWAREHKKKKKKQHKK